MLLHNTHTKEKIKKTLNIDFLTELLKYLLQEHRSLQHNATNVVTAMNRDFTPKFLELYIKKSKIKGTNSRGAKSITGGRVKGVSSRSKGHSRIAGYLVVEILASDVGY